jgi:tRNA(fMet)-specific endonuclease VapC
MARFIDTNIFVACLRGRADHVRDRFLQHPPGEILVPFQVLAELKLGAAKSARPEHHARQVDNILQPFGVAWPDNATAEHYVDIRSSLERAGNIISQPDLWIAAITRAAGGILVTHNTDEFSRVPGLMLEDWLQP